MFVCCSIDDPLALFDKIYDKPWTRLGPYLVGMSVGWILFKTDCKMKMHRVKYPFLNVLIVSLTVFVRTLPPARTWQLSRLLKMFLHQWICYIPSNIMYVSAYMFCENKI